MTVDDNMTVNAVHVDDQCTVDEIIACAARTTTDECTVEVNVHAVHLRCTVKRHIVHAVHVGDECTVNDNTVQLAYSVHIAVHVAPARFGTYHSCRLASSRRPVNE